MTESLGLHSEDHQDLNNLCQKIIAGDSVAENQFVAMHYRWLLFIVRKKFNGTDLHMDIVQDAFVLVLAKLKQNDVKQHHTIKAYLRTCAINIGYEYVRKDKKYASAVDQDYLDLFADGQTAVLDQLQWQEGIEYVKQVMEELPTPRDREILTQFYFNEYSKQDICQELELKSAHFDRVIYRAKQRLKALIESKGESNNDPSTPAKQANRDNMQAHKDSKNNKLMSKLMALLRTIWNPRDQRRAA